jgi:hypothetical protein
MLGLRGAVDATMRSSSLCEWAGLDARKTVQAGHFYQRPYGARKCPGYALAMANDTDAKAAGAITRAVGKSRVSPGWDINSGRGSGDPATKV